MPLVSSSPATLTLFLFLLSISLADSVSAEAGVLVDSASVLGDSVLAEPSAVDKAVGVQASGRSNAAALALLFYDILLSFDEEVQLIWPKPRSLTKFLYFFIRYVPLVVQISVLFVGTELSPQFHFTPHACFIWEAYQGAATICITVAVDYILILRLFALYFDNRCVRWVIKVGYGLEIVGMAVGLGLAVPGIRFDEICLTNFVPSTIIIYGGSSVLFQALIFALTLYKFLTEIRHGWGSNDVVGLLMRDGTWAFFLLFFLLVGQASLALLKNKALASVLFGWSLSGLSFSGYRILLNLNKLSAPPNSTGRWTRSLEFSSVVLDTVDLDAGMGSGEEYELSDMSSSSRGFSSSSRGFSSSSRGYSSSSSRGAFPSSSSRGAFSSSSSPLRSTAISSVLSGPSSSSKGP
ncbi:hypothetical protein C8J56DRAFT_125657 [Mycena floridula]|nr:hypothetical protein C8J56DRAFT_125657 [Mycena floridula]